jgi:hypothetical protein
MLNSKKLYKQVPGKTVFDIEMAVQGYHLYK